MDIIRYLDTFSYIVQLVSVVIIEVKNYFLFLILWVIMFAFFYQAVGVIDGESGDASSNPNHNIFKYVSTSWKMSTKGNPYIGSLYWQ